MTTELNFHTLDLRSHSADGTMQDLTRVGDYHHSGKGWGATTAYSPFSRFEVKQLVIVANGNVYMANELFQTLNMYAEWGEDYYRVGARKFCKVTADALYQALNSACYERRSQREVDVATRNLGAIEWLMSL